MTTHAFTQTSKQSHFTATEAAAVLKISRRSVGRWLKRGWLTSAYPEHGYLERPAKHIRAESVWAAIQHRVDAEAKRAISAKSYMGVRRTRVALNAIEKGLVVPAVVWSFATDVNATFSFPDFIFDSPDMMKAAMNLSHAQLQARPDYSALLARAAHILKGRRIIAYAADKGEALALCTALEMVGVRSRYWDSAEDYGIEGQFGYWSDTDLTKKDAYAEAKILEPFRRGHFDALVVTESSHILSYLGANTLILAKPHLSQDAFLDQFNAFKEMSEDYPGWVIELQFNGGYYRLA